MAGLIDHRVARSCLKQGAASGTVDNPTFARLHLSASDSRPVEGAIVKSFAHATTQKSARAAIAQARTVLWGSPPKFDLKAEVAAEISSYVEKVFTADQTLLEQLICNFQLTVGSGSPQADLEALVRSHPVSPSKVVDITNYICGVVSRFLAVWCRRLL